MAVHDLPDGLSLGEVLQEFLAMHDDCNTVVDLTGDLPRQR
jgi:hypothetical protein